VALFKSATNDSSYTVSGFALEALSKVDEPAALSLAKELSNKPSKGQLQDAITSTIVKSGDESMADVIIGNFAKMPLGNNKFNMLQTLGNYLAVLKNTEKFKQGVDEIIKLRDAVPESFKGQTDPFINNMVLKGIITKKESTLKEAKPTDSSLQEQIDYVKSKLPAADEKKGF